MRNLKAPKTMFPARTDSRLGLANVLSVFVFAVITACSSPTGSPVVSVDEAHVDELLVVDCLLPGRVRQLGSQLTYLEPPRPAKTSAVECEIRGGEYTSWDRANFATALKIWLPKAKEGDAQAQNYVGEIFEKGLGVPPDHGASFEWYSKAAEQGYSPAQINLGQLYEKGLGVELNVATAMNWYRKASGLEELQVAYVPSPEAVAELEGLKSELSEQSQTVAQLHKELDTRSRELVASRKERQARQREIEKENAALAVSREKLELANSNIRQEQERIEAEAKRLEAERKEFETQIAEASSPKQIVEAGQGQLERAAYMLSSLYAALTTRESVLADRSSEISERTEQRNAEIERERQALETARIRLASERKTLLDARARNAEEAKKLERDRAQLAAQMNSATSTASDIEAARKDQDRIASQLAITTAAHARREKLLTKRAQELESREARQADVEQQRVAVVAASQTLAAEREKLKNERAALEAESKKLDTSRAQLAKQTTTASNTGEAITAARAQLERAAALAALQAQVQENRLDELKAREQELASRETEYAKKQKEITTLDAQIADLRAEAEQQRTDVVMLAQNNAVNLPGPTIQIIDPLIPLTRGLTVTMAIPPAATRLLVGRVEAPAGLLSLTINDQEVKTDDKGIFRSDVVLSEGDTHVTLVAIDRDGKRGDRTFLLRASDKVRGPTRPKVAKRPRLKFGDYYALVIGNNNYTKLPRLETAVTDATAIGDVLTERYGFKVTTLTNATRYEILSALNTMRGKLTEDDNLLIYYAGHGELDKVNMRGHWLPVDAEPTSTANWISNIALTDILNTMSARHVMVVADSCYSGALTRSSLARLEAGLTPEARESWQRAMLGKRSRTALTSGGLAPVLDAGGGKHSIFAKALIDTLRANSDVLEGQRLFQELSAQVTWAAEAKNFEQIPQYAPIKYAGHESGEFFFVPEG